MAVDAVARAIAAGKVPVDAYEMAVAGGYTGTKEQFEEDMGNSGTNAANAANSATAAAASATAAANAAGNLAPAYSASATYAVGDHVLYDGGYYVCNTAITTAEAWTAAHWTAVKVGPEITDLTTQVDKLIDLPTENLLDVTDFTVTSNSNVSVDTVNNTVTITTKTQGTYRCVQTAETFVPLNLVAGQSYRLHAKAEKISGNPEILVGIRGIEGNVNGLAASFRLTDGESGFIDFTADQYMQRVCLFVTFGTSASASVKFSELWLKAYDTSGKDIEARNYLLSQQLKLPRNFWVRKSGLNNSGAYTDSNDKAVTVNSMIVHGFIRVVSNDKNIHISFFNTQNNQWIDPTETENEWILETETPYYCKIVASCLDGTEMTGEKLDNIYIYTNPTTAAEYESKHYYKIENSYRFPAYDASNTIMFRQDMDTSAGNIGTLLRKDQTSRTTWKECVCETSDCVLWCGQFTQSSMVIVIDNEVAATITRGMSFTVPKGKRFICSFLTSSDNKQNHIETTCFHIVPNSTPSWGGYQLLSDSGLSGQDSSFNIGDKIYCIGRENTGYSIKQGDTWLVSKQSLGINVGHANSCNYDSKTQKAYVSDWTDPGKIYTFSVDDENNALTYDKTIDMPTQDGQGSTEYYVFDNEKQVFYLGWETGNSGTDPNTMIMGLFVLTTTGYVKSWEKKVVRAVCIQSMVVQNNYMYYVEVNPSDSYHTLGVNRINISTGVTEYNNNPVGGTIATVEAEGISAIGEGAFIIMARNGYTFLSLFKKADAIYD